MKAIYHFIIVSALMFSFSYSSPALGLSGNSISPIIYIPGAIITNHYTVSGTDRPISINVDTTTFSSIKINQTSAYEFDLIIQFPKDKYIAPGDYNFGLTVTEKEEEHKGVSGKVLISKSFTVNVYSYSKEVEVSLNAPSINQHEQMTFGLYVKSLGYPEIEDVHGQIVVYDSSLHELAKINTESKSLPGLETISFNPTLDTSSWLPNSYSAKAYLEYDGKSKTANTSFLIGQEDISVINYTSELNQGFSEFSLVVRNEWGQALKNVYALLSLEGTEVTQTPSITLESWGEGTVKNIIRLENPPGTYEGILTLHFNDKKKMIPLTIKILPATETAEQKKIALVTNMLWKISLVLILMATVGVIFWWKYRKNKTN